MKAYLQIILSIRKEVKIHINRELYQGDTAQDRVEFCLNQLEKAKNFKKGIDWEIEIVDRLTVEEVIGALVSAEQYINENLEVK